MNDLEFIPESPVIGAIRKVYTALCGVLLLAGIVAPVFWQMYQSATRRTSENAPTPITQPESQPTNTVTRSSAPDPRDKEVATRRATAPPVPVPTTVPPPATYRVTAIDPIPATGSDVSIQLQECHRDGDGIICLMKIENHTDATMRRFEFALRTAIDDEGNSVNGECETTSTDALPQIPMNGMCRINDPHQDVRLISLEILWGAGSRIRLPGANHHLP